MDLFFFFFKVTAGLHMYVVHDGGSVFKPSAIGREREKRGGKKKSKRPAQGILRVKSPRNSSISTPQLR
jgi:hypothetical protein